MPEGNAIDAIAEAIAWWRADLADGRSLLASAAADALASGFDGAALAELAGIGRSENPFAVDALIDGVATELDLGEALAVPSERLAASRMCRLVVSGEMAPRELTRWVHTTFHHRSGSVDLDILAELDDEYDLRERSGGAPEETASRVLETAARFLADSRASRPDADAPVAGQ